MTTAQKVASSIDSALAKAEETGSVSAGGDGVAARAASRSALTSPTACARLSQNVAQAFTGAPEPTTAQKVAGGIDSALAKAEEAIASVTHTIAGDKSASQPTSQPPAAAAAAAASASQPAA